MPATAFPTTRRSQGKDHKPIQHAVGQHLPDEARRVARRVFHPRPGQPVRPGVRPAGQPLFVPIATAGRSISSSAGPGIPASASRTTASGSARTWSPTTTARPGSAASASTRPTSFRKPYRGTVFVGNVVTNRINHDRIEWHGSSPKGIEQPDFVWSEDNWFRPVDIELGPDGALYVADFYNRIIGHYEVPLTHPGRDRERGRIWRIVYKGTDGKPAPAPDRRPIGPSRRSRSWSPTWLIPTWSVRISAANQLVDRGGEPAIAAVRSDHEARNAAAPASPWPLGPRARRHASTTRRCWPAPPTPTASCASTA